MLLLAGISSRCWCHAVGSTLLAKPSSRNTRLHLGPGRRQRCGSCCAAALVVIFISAGITVAQSLQRAYKRRKLASGLSRRTKIETESASPQLSDAQRLEVLACAANDARHAARVTAELAAAAAAHAENVERLQAALLYVGDPPKSAAELDTHLPTTMPSEAQHVGMA